MNHTRLTRRRFVSSSAALAVAGVAAPGLLLGRFARGESLNARLNVAAIGVGGHGTEIGHQAGRLGNMVACADVHLGNAGAFARKYGGRCQVYQDYRELLDRKDVDVVTCATPDHWHAKITIDAMKAGKDVYCEKPLTLTMEEGRLVCEATEQTGRVLQVGTQQRSEYGQDFLKAVAIARSGRLGSRLHALASVGGAASGGPWPLRDPPKELDWDFWLGQAPEVPFCPNRIGWNFRWWYEYSGGQVTDWGVHHADIAVWALGGEETGIVEAAPAESNFPLGRKLTCDTLLGKTPFADLPPSYNVPNHFKVDMKLPNRNAITLYSGKNELLISGAEGKIRVNRGGLTGVPVDEINASQSDLKWLDEEVRKLYRGMPLDGHMANFFHCVKTRRKPISDVWTHLSSVNACHMANVALLLGRTVRYDPARGRFRDDTEADALMSRPQRKPYQIVA